MKVVCPHCGGNSGIRNSKQITGFTRELYCHCENPLCDAGFVMSLAHKHDTQPPRPVMEQAVIALVRRLSPHEKQQLLAIISHPGE